jgi:hypothetical protein
MKKIVLVVLTIALGYSVSHAQVDKSFYQKSYESRNNGTFDQATSLVSFGLGVPSIYTGSYYRQSPTIYGKYEHGFLRDEVGLGGYLAAGFGSYKFQGSGERYKYSSFSFAVLGYYHFNKLIPIEKMDVYAGAGLGFSRHAWNDDNLYNDDDNSVLFVVKVGIRYYVVKNFAVYAESGWDDMSSVNFGGTFRF